MDIEGLIIQEHDFPHGYGSVLVLSGWVEDIRASSGSHFMVMDIMGTAVVRLLCGLVDGCLDYLVSNNTTLVNQIITLLYKNKFITITSKIIGFEVDIW